ncbi:hypothetical protein VUR80DRAFT_265 [Thermomyces stellatus]
MPSLENFTVVVTGAAGGLGKAIATAFLSSGANAAICDVSPERLASTSSEWESSHAGRFLASQTDITDEAAVTSFFAAVVDKFGKVDMLVNNAGIMDAFDPVGETERAMWDRVLAVNLTGSFLATKAAVNVMLSRGGGTIINIGSVASYRGGAAGAAYTASKHAVAGLSKNTAGFYGPKGISSIVLYIGGMEETNIAASFQVNPPNTEAMARMKELTPGYVAGETSVKIADVAKYCVFFADRDIAATSNGAEITVNKNWPAA